MTIILKIVKLNTVPKIINSLKYWLINSDNAAVNIHSQGQMLVLNL